MGNGDKYRNSIKHLTPKQTKRTSRKANRIKSTSQGGEWYKAVDPDTGAIKYLRKSEKKKKRKK